VRNRPQRNTRRGLLRASLAVTILVILFIIILFIVSSLTAPSVKAPVVPPTPGPLKTATSRPTTTKTPRASPGPSKTATKKTLGLGARSRRTPPTLMLERGNGLVRYHPAPGWPVGAVPARAGGAVAFFNGPGDAYGRSRLYVRPANGSRVLVGAGDALIPPVWSADGRSLLFVRVSAVKQMPLARWTLLLFDVQTHRVQVLAQNIGLSLTPLGWRGSDILYLLANSTDTSMYTVAGGHAVFRTLLMPQVITSAVLSPGARYLAFTAPTNCGYCTLDIYDFAQDSIWIGPSGVLEYDRFVWSNDGRTLAAQLYSSLLLVDVLSHRLRYCSAGRDLSHLWRPSLRARIAGGTLILYDSLGGASYRARPTSDRG
jgi:hypothetical protein